MESSGTACGLDWLNRDASHTSYRIAIFLEHTLLLGLGIFCLQSAKTHWDNNKATDKVTDKAEVEWFTEKQLVWVGIAINIVSLK